MKIQIKNRYTGAVIFECETDSLKLAVELAVKSRVNLSGADLSGVNLSGMDLSGADLYGADLSEVNLSRTNLYGMDLSGVNLYGANLSGANLSGANLSGVNLSGVNLSRTNLSKADLSKADLYGVKITKIPVQISGLKWWVNITEKHIQIGCKVYEAVEWFNFSDEKIMEMDSEALIFWKANKEFIKMTWENHTK